MEPYRTAFTTARRRLDGRLYPMQLFQKAKRLGVWDPRAFDLAHDREDWLGLNERERDLLLRLTTLFEAGEESVTYDLLPLLQVAAAEGRVEEELFLTTYLWEEAKHVEAFHRVLDEIAGAEDGLERYYTDAYRRIFLDVLPRAMDRLRADAAPEALAEAAVTYQMVVEGVLAETGYHAYYAMLERNDLMPGLRAMVQQVQQDESRHIAYGVFLLSRLVAEHGEPLWTVIDRRMNDLLPLAVQIIAESLEPYGDDIPFGLTADDFVDFGMAQFQKRYARIERARHQPLEVVLYGQAEAAAGRAT